MRLYFPVDLTGNVRIIEKFVSGKTVIDKFFSWVKFVSLYPIKPKRGLMAQRLMLRAEDQEVHGSSSFVLGKWRMACPQNPFFHHSELAPANKHLQFD